MAAAVDQPLLTGLDSTNTDVALTSTISLGILREQDEKESRVTLTPETCAKLVKQGYTVSIELNAGKKCGYDDDAYKAAGCEMRARAQVVAKSQVLFCINPPVGDFPNMKDRIIVAWVQRRADSAKDAISKARQNNITLMDVTAIPRISIAQKFDVLSSQAAVAGHRAIVEATYYFGRFHEGAMTAAGKYPPSQTFILGCGVAGLAAIGAARAMGSIVQAWDVRSVCEEQVESLGGKWVKVNFKEDGAGTGGYAKESSAAFAAAQKATFLEVCKKVDIVITTAAIPGRPSPVLIEDNMVRAMKPGSVIVDLASVGGGNVSLTQRGKKYVTPNGVTIIGYDNFPSLMPQQASLMYGTNLLNLLGHITGKGGPGNFIPAVEDALAAGENGDLTIRNLVCTRDGKEYEFPAQPDPSPPKPKSADKVVMQDASGRFKDSNPLCAAFLIACLLTVIFMGLCLLGMEMSGIIFVSFLLAGVAGYQVVWGVAPALHTPLISITNAISGLTAVGGLILMKNPNQNIQVKVLAAISIVVSAINIVGGFIVTKRMLLLFQKKGQVDYSYFLFIPGIGLIILSLVSRKMDEPVGVIAALLCIAAIAGLSTYKTANQGVALGINAVVVAVVATVMTLPNHSILLACAYMAGGAVVGLIVGLTVDAMSLPQTVAAFHSLVGIAAFLTAIGEFEQDRHKLGLTQQNIFIVLGDFIGAVTFTGSIVAFTKLHGIVGSKALDLPGKNFINLLMLAGYIVMATFFIISKSHGFALAMLWGVAGLGAVVGFHLVASVGGGDMPVCITVLNSYSGWALVMEGFMLNSILLTVVGSLIGFSGAILTKIMCDAMNRDIMNVIFGGFNTVKKEKIGDQEQKEHTETSPGQVAEMLAGANNVLIVPGYGMAAGRAQNEVADIARALDAADIGVKFGIHPVAGRMPGQMNVLLAEAGVPYDWVYEMDEVNPDMEKFDVCMIVGANDITNSSAKTDPDCAIAGMPVLEVWRCKKVVFCKRSMAGGYADLENPVFFNENTDMLLGNAKETCDHVSTQFKELMASRV